MKHSDMVTALAKPGCDILDSLKASDCHNLHMCMGAAGELGETIDVIKKSIFYRKPLDREKVIEEMGDLEFYLEGLRQGLCVTRDEILEANTNKLGKRYSEFKYSDKAAIKRADKA